MIGKTPSIKEIERVNALLTKDSFVAHFLSLRDGKDHSEGMPTQRLSIATSANLASIESSEFRGDKKEKLDPIEAQYQT